jgi:uncharacterized protein (TIGR00297 family)
VRDELFLRPSIPKAAAPSHALRRLYAQLRAASDWSGVAVILAQAAVLHMAFGPGGAAMLLTAATGVTISALFRNAHPLAEEKKEGPRTWKNAVANAGAATLLAVTALAHGSAEGKAVLAAAAVGSLAAALSDTFSHDIGELYGGAPRLITTWRRVRPGENGAVSLLGTAAGVAAALCFSGMGVLCGIISLRASVVVVVAACVGNATDSILGATLERRGWADNDLVNLGAVSSSSISVLILMF